MIIRWTRATIVSLTLSAASGCTTYPVARLDGMEEDAEPVAIPERSTPISIYFVTGDSFGPLHHNGAGWLAITITNSTHKELPLTQAAQFGKGGLKDPGQPSFGGDGGYYRGFALANFKYEFLNEQGKSVHSGLMSPPDGVTLAAGKSQWIWRQISAPPEAGVYKLRVTLDRRQVQEANNMRAFGDGTLQGDLLATVEVVGVKIE